MEFTNSELALIAVGLGTIATLEHVVLPDGVDKLSEDGWNETVELVSRVTDYLKG